MEPIEFIPTRKSLLSRLKSWDDQDSWREFFDTYWRLIYSVARKSGLTEAEAQDVVQETLISVAERMPGFKYDPKLGSFKSWLMRILRRRIADHLREQYRKPPSIGLDRTQRSEEETVEEVADGSFEHLESIWDEEWRAHLHQAALEKVKRRVKPEQFQMFDFYALQGLPVRQVAKILGASLMQVYLVRHRVAKLLRDEVANLEKRML
jgi:RNA polymerase sigma-70 factor (ECF subfamily)